MNSSSKLIIFPPISKIFLKKLGISIFFCFVFMIIFLKT